jgi:hypothetical protein
MEPSPRAGAVLAAVCALLAVLGCAGLAVLLMGGPL